MGGVFAKNTSLETIFHSAFGSENCSSLDWYFSQISLPDMLYLYIMILLYDLGLIVIFDSTIFRQLLCLCLWHPTQVREDINKRYAELRQILYDLRLFVIFESAIFLKLLFTFVTSNTSTRRYFLTRYRTETHIFSFDDRNHGDRQETQKKTCWLNLMT